MTPGPAKAFDPDATLHKARDVFWQRGYDGTGVRVLEGTLGIGRKSLYDTFGSKRALFLRALECYTDTVIERICGRLDHPDGTAMENLERALGRLAEHHGSGDSKGCLLGVAMAQADADDAELAEVLTAYLGRLERAFERALRRGLAEGEVAQAVRPKDAARNLVALTQGMALLGRIDSTVAAQRSIIRAALAALRN
jgi:TetR/AcrR family transcriptional repressor of nem operon